MRCLYSQVPARVRLELVDMEWSDPDRWWCDNWWILSDSPWSLSAIILPTTAPLDCFSDPWPLPTVPTVMLSVVTALSLDWLLMATEIRLQESWTSSGSDPPDDNPGTLLGRVGRMRIFRVWILWVCARRTGYHGRTRWMFHVTCDRSANRVRCTDRHLEGEQRINLIS